VPFDARSDLPHAVPPEALTGGLPGWPNLVWKENWVFPSLDVGQRVASVFHFSLRPAQGEGIFTAKVNAGDWRHRHVGRSPLPAGLAAQHPVRGERLSLTVAEPGRRFEIAYRSPELDADLEYTGRFPAWDFHDGPRAPGASSLGERGLWVFHFDHCEQGLSMRGRLRIGAGERAGEELLVAGYGNRDHSWGWRDDHLFRHHHWLCASFPDRYVQGTLMEDASYPAEKFGGFVSSASGNVGVVRLDAGDPAWHRWEVGLPALDDDVTYRLHTADGAVCTVVAHLGRDLGRHHLDFRAADRSQAYEDCQIFCEFTLVETGARGSGVLELGKRVEGAGRVAALGSEARR
jgi:hypothetical protein